MRRRPSGKEVSGGGFRQYGAKILITYTEMAGKGSVCKWNLPFFWLWDTAAVCCWKRTLGEEFRFWNEGEEILAFLTLVQKEVFSEGMEKFRFFGYRHPSIGDSSLRKCHPGSHLKQELQIISPLAQKSFASASGFSGDQQLQDLLSKTQINSNSSWNKTYES